MRIGLGLDWIGLGLDWIGFFLSNLRAWVMATEFRLNVDSRNSVTIPHVSSLSLSSVIPIKTRLFAG